MADQIKEVTKVGNVTRTTWSKGWVTFSSTTFDPPFEELKPLFEGAGHVTYTLGSFTRQRK